MQHTKEPWVHACKASSPTRRGYPDWFTLRQIYRPQKTWAVCLSFVLCAYRVRSGRPSGIDGRTAGRDPLRRCVAAPRGGRGTGLSSGDGGERGQRPSLFSPCLCSSVRVLRHLLTSSMWTPTKAICQGCHILCFLDPQSPKTVLNPHFYSLCVSGNLTTPPWGWKGKI
jgi:hypothetical protein